MNCKKQGRPVFFRILISYFLIMILPMIVLGGMISGFLYRTYHKELIRSQQQSLSSSQAMMDTIIREMQSNAMILLNSGEFQTRHLRQAYGNFYDITNRLSILSYTNIFVDEYFYLNSEMKHLFNRETMFSYDTFCKYGIPYRNMTEKNLENILLKNAMSYWIPMEQDGEESFLTYVVTDKTSWHTPKNAIIFRLKEHTLNKILNVEQDSQQSCAIIISNNIPIFGSSPDFSESIWNRIRNQVNGEKGSFRSKIDGSDYMVFYSRSEATNDLCFILTVSYDAILRQTSAYQIMFLVLVLLTALICSAFILRFMNVIYGPLQQFSGMINRILGIEPVKNDSEQISAAQQALIQIEQNNRRNKLRKLIIELFCGCFQDQKQLERAIGQMGFILHGSRYNVILLQLKAISSGSISPSIFDDIGTFWEKNLPKEITGYSLAFPETAAVALLTVGEAQDFAILYQQIPDLKQLSESNWPVKIAIGIGEENDVSNVPTAYFQASKACEYILFQQKGGILFFHDIINTEQWKSLYPNHDIDCLYHAIGQIDFDRIILSVQLIQSDILNTESFLYGSYILRDTMLTAIRALQEMECNTMEFSQLNQQFAFALDSEDSLRQFCQNLLETIKRTLSSYEKPQKFESEPSVDRQILMKDILSYISDHFCEDSFSVRSVADEFQMSVSNLSHFFKKNSGQNISEYIASLRFERAKELLRDTNMVLQDISDSCGYLHLSTFMRQFKQRENCTPAIYRSRFHSK